MKKILRNTRGITLIALVVTIVVLLILAGVTLNAVFSDNGIIQRARDAQTKTNQGMQKDLEPMGALEDLINKNAGENKSEETVKISTIVGKGAVTQNTKAEDAYGNKITVPKGFKVLPHNPSSSTGAVTYTYNEDNTPAVQDGIVIENETDGNQFVWVPVGTIKNKDNTTSTITLGRYLFSDIGDAAVLVQSATDYAVTTLEKIKAEESTITKYRIEYLFYELNDKLEGNSTTDSTAQNATARDLKTFIETSLANGGYYIARFEASQSDTKIESKFEQTVLTSITQPSASKLAREMYGEVKENNELIYASDLVNSYAWDTAIIFIQTYSGKTDYELHNESEITGEFTLTGLSNDKYCNIWDMSGNANEWTTEYTEYSLGGSKNFMPCTHRGGGCYTDENAEGVALNGYTSERQYVRATGLENELGLRALLYVK